MERAKAELDDEITYCSDAYEAAEESDCVILMTEWNEFKEIDFERVKSVMKQPAILDGRNIYDPVRLKEMGFKYAGMGRGV
jgi:UDPglucose 6-dehydrogenase